MGTYQPLIGNGKPGSAYSHTTEQAGGIFNKYNRGLRSKIEQDEREARLNAHLNKKKKAMADGQDSDGSDAEGKAKKKLKIVQSDSKRRATKNNLSSRRHSSKQNSEAGESRAGSRQSRVVTPVVFDD